MTFTMTVMTLDCQQRTQTMLTASLGKKGIQKPSFLDVFTFKFHSVKTPPDTLNPNNVSDNDSDKDYIPTMTNEQMIMSIYNLKFKTQQQQQQQEVYCRQSMYGTYKWPTETQYSYLVSNYALYRTCYDITSDHIRML